MRRTEVVRVGLLGLAVTLVGITDAPAGVIASFSFKGPDRFQLLTTGGNFEVFTDVHFNYVESGISGNPLPGFDTVEARLHVFGSLVPGSGVHVVPTGALSQAAQNLFFTIIASNPADPFFGGNLLSGVMQSGVLSGTFDSRTAALAGSNTGVGAGTITFSSDFLSFDGGPKSYSFALEDVITTGPPPDLGPKFLASSSPIPDIELGNIVAFTGGIAGLFSAEETVIITSVPEPSTVLSLGVGGISLIGLVVRRRTKVARLAPAA